MICSILLLITLTSCVSGLLVVNVTQRSYQAEENHNVTLEWTFKTTTDGSLKSINIFCEMFTDLTSFTLFDLHEGVEVSESQHERFAGRVQFDKDVLREGQLRLHMSRLRTNDSGLYQCKADDGEGSRKCHLNVTAERVRPKPETPNTTSGGRDASTTGSPSQPERRGRIGLYCGLGLMVVGALLGVCCCLRRKHSMNHSAHSTRVIKSHSAHSTRFSVSHSAHSTGFSVSRSVHRTRVTVSHSVHITGANESHFLSRALAQDPMNHSPSIELDPESPSLELDPESLSL